MVKKWMWITPLSILATGAVIGGAVGGYFANYQSNFKIINTYATYPTASSNASLIQAYLSSEVKGTKLISAPGFTHTQAIIQALDTSKGTNSTIYSAMNKLGFMLLDDTYGLPLFDEQNKLTGPQPLWTSNVSATLFRTDLGTFLVGIALGQFLNEYQYYFGDDDRLTYATYGGLPFSSVTGFMGGLQRGVKWFNENIVPYAKTKDNKPYKVVEQVFANDTDQGNFAGGFGPTDGNNIINILLLKKVDALMPVAGSQTQQAARLISQQKAKTILVGVDSASENDTNTNLFLPVGGSQEVNGSTAIGGTNRIIQFSSLKKLDKATEKIITNINNGMTPDQAVNSIGGLGYISLGTIDNELVGNSLAGYQYFLRAIKMYIASYNQDPDNYDPSQSLSGTQVAVTPQNIEKIFQIPNNSPDTNIPTSPEYSAYYTDELINKYTKVITNLQIFKDLNLAENKFYEYGSATKTKTFYQDFLNDGKPMMPLDVNQIDGWYQKHLASSQNLTSSDFTKISNLKAWLTAHQSTVEIRSKFSLKDQLAKEAYERNNSVVRIAINSPTVPLLDKSFNESAFDGLIAYWKKFGFIIKKP